jgi:hypothetical protein
MLPPLPRWIGIGGSVMSLSRFGLPRILGGSASTTVLSGPSQGSLALRPARLLQPYRLTSVPRASAGRSPYPTVWVATGMNRQFPGRNFHPLASCAIVAHQHVVVMKSSAKSLISPTYDRFSKPNYFCDIHFFNGYVPDMLCLRDTADIQ